MVNFFELIQPILGSYVVVVVPCVPLPPVTSDRCLKAFARVPVCWRGGKGWNKMEQVGTSRNDC